MHHKRHKKTFFDAWKNETIRGKNLRRVNEKIDSYLIKRTLKTCLKAWNEQTMQKNKTKIKNNVLAQT